VRTPLDPSQKRVSFPIRSVEESTMLLKTAIILIVLSQAVNSQDGTRTAKITKTRAFPPSCFLNVLIMLDRSDSVKGGFNQSRDFVLDVSQELVIRPDRHDVSMIVYSGMSYKREIYKWGTFRDNEQFYKTVRGLRAVGGTTNTGKALEEALKLMAMDSRNKTSATVVMMVTDGRSADDTSILGPRLRDMPNVFVFAGVAGDPKNIGMKDIMNYVKSTEQIVKQSGRAKASDLARGILKDAQKDCPKTTTTSTTTTTTTTNPITGCELDLVFVLDFSTTTDPIYKEYKKMAAAIVKKMKIGPHHTQISCVTFSSAGKTSTAFNLKRYKDNAGVLSGIEGLEYYGGTTAIGQGIMEGLNQTDEKHGAREEATRAMIVFTDGWNNKGPDPMEASKKATDAGFEIYTVGFTGDMENMVKTNMTALEMIAEDGAHSFTQATLDKLIEKVGARGAPCLNGGIVPSTPSPRVPIGRGKPTTKRTTTKSGIRG
ncbi:hypothetical protein PFISCL1PPCAC_16097, partial [Pristionchus fissidentatus]